MLRWPGVLQFRPPSMRPRRLRCCLHVGLLLLLTAVRAEPPLFGSLDVAIAAATAPQRVDQRTEQRDENRNEAITTLGKWPRTAPADEERIAAALGASLQASDVRIRSSAAQALGHERAPRIHSAPVRKD